MCVCGAPCKARNFNVFIYGPTFDNAESRLYLFAAQCVNIESMQEVILWHSCVYNTLSATKVTLITDGI
jgi:hypothetical protein